MGSIFIAAAIITLFVYRKWKVEQEIAGLVWKIEPKDILNHQSADGFMDKSTSKVSFFLFIISTFCVFVTCYEC